LGAASSAFAALVLCAGLALPASALAQPAHTSERHESPFATWILLGADLAVHGRWRAVVRIGHLGDVESRIVLAESILVVRPAVHVLLGYVYVVPTAPNTARTSLTRAGATWLPVRGRLTIENRFLFEHRVTTAARASIRGRNRIRISGSQPGGLPFAVFASVETIAATFGGLIENRIQLGATRSVGRLSLESYWLHRRLPARTVVNGVGLTTSWRIGT
jgi:hypothetical protein